MSERRKVFGEKFVDLGNFTVVALIFGQLVAEKKSYELMTAGIVIVAVFWIIGFFILKEKGRRKK